MLKSKCLLASAACTVLFGLLLLALGIALPIVIQKSIDAGLNDLWMKPHEYSSWGMTPGKLGIKIVREYTLFNLTNPEEFSLGAKPKVVEIGTFPFQEYSHFKDWTYLDDDLTPIGQDVTPIQKTGNFIAYNNQLELVPLPRNSSFDIPLDTNITTMNAVSSTQAFYMGFYALAHQEFPFYSMMFLYDAYIALQDDLYPLVIAKVLWSAYFSDPEFMAIFKLSLGLPTKDVYLLVTDSTYGFVSYSNLRMWVEAILQYRELGTLEDGAAAIILNHFQIGGLEAMFEPQGFLWEAVDAVLADMLGRYGTNDPTELAYYQWATMGVLGDLPLDQGSLSTPYYLSLNLSFDYPLEIKFIQEKVNSTVDMLPQAPNLLNPQYSFPMNNTSSLLSLDSMASFFDSVLANDYDSAVAQFNLSSEEQILPIASYLVYMGNYSITFPDGSQSLDGYSMGLARLVRKSLVNETTALRYDAYFATMARTLFCNYTLSNTSCETIISQGNANVAKEVCTEFGWNISEVDSWVQVQLWFEAAMKSNTSAAFQQLLSFGLLTAGELNAILYEGFQAISTDALKVAEEFSRRYQCSQIVCTYDDLFYLQLGASGVTNNLPSYLSKCGVANTTTMMDWFPSRYRTPIEWMHIQKFPMPSFLASTYLSYSAFFNPTFLKLFFNSYFASDFGQLIATFSFPNTEIIYLLYNYFVNTIPGYGFAITDTIYSLVYGGGVNTYLDFIANMNIYEGGFPSTNPFYRLSTFTNETAQFAKHIMYSGKNDSSLTRTYYAFYGHHNMDLYWPGYDEQSPTASSWQYSDIWQGYNPINGSDGGQFGTKIHDDDKPYVFVSSLLRWFELSRVGTDHYHGLDLGHFVMSPWQLKNSLKEPINAVFWQLPTVLEGFMNISSQMGNVPVMINLPHCYLCDEGGMNMIEYYAYTNDSEKFMSERIFPHQIHDQPFAAIEQETGVGVKLVLVFQVNIGLQRDYFYPNFYQEKPDWPLYFPFYVLKRSVNYTYDQVQDNFGPLMQARQLKVVFLLVGTIVGSVFTVGGMVLAYWYYRKTRNLKNSNESKRTIISQGSKDSSSGSQQFLNSPR